VNIVQEHRFSLCMLGCLCKVVGCKESDSSIIYSHFYLKRFVQLLFCQRMMTVCLVDHDLDLHLVIQFANFGVHEFF
jgi:hypothetical protein